jgi:antitoxin (DNA-binding transcriptional repressor) of toxin-antitoxin stability system
MQTLHTSAANPITIPATQFVRQCREVLDSLQRGGEVIITRHQQQIARLMPIEPNRKREYTMADAIDRHYSKASPLDTGLSDLMYSLRDEPQESIDPWER